MAGIAVMKDSCRLYVGKAGTDLKVADKMSHVVSIGEVGQDTEEIDTTALDSMAKESQPGFTDFGTLSVEQNITADEYTKLKTWCDAGTDLDFGIIADDKTGTAVLELAGTGYIKTCKWGGASVGGLLKVTAEIKISGALKTTFTEPTTVTLKA